MPQPHICHLQYRPDIDGLRAVAIVLVVIFHAFPALIPGGFIGVDIFFVISGFLISSVVIKSLERGTFSFPDFFRRRVRRIFPGLVLMLAACLAFGWFALLPAEYTQLGKHVLGGAGFGANFVLWSEAGYFGTAAETKPLLHLWSLGVEEQFYLVWPVLLWFAWRRFNLLYLAFGLCIASFAWNVAMIYEDPSYSFYFPQTRLWELMTGAVLAGLLHHRHPLLRAGWRRHCSLGGMALIGGASMTLSRTDYFPGWWALMPTLGAALIIFAGTSAWINRALLASPATVWIGKISYPFYLWHWPLLSFAYIMEAGAPAASIRCTAIVIAGVLAWLTYQLVEQPVRRNRFQGAVAGLVVCLVAAGAAGAASYYADGFPKRHSLELSIAKYDSELDWMRNYRVNAACRKAFPALAVANDCMLAKDSAPTIFLLGDSHANNLYPGLMQATDGTPDNVLNAAAWMCPPMFDVEVARGGERGRNSCTKRMNPILRLAIENESVKTVVIAGRGALYVSGTGYGPAKDEAAITVQLNEVTHPEFTDSRVVFKHALRETLARLGSSGKRIVFVLDPPELGFDPKSCVFARPVSLTSPSIRQPCAIPKDEFDRRSASYREAAFSVLKDFPSVVVFDAAKLFCDDKWCWGLRGGELLYRDDDHLSVAGSRNIARELIKLIHLADEPH